MSQIDLPVIQPPPALKPPSSLVVRYGYMRMMAEFPYDGDTRPGCGARVVCRTPRGTEMAEVMTTTCGNGGCAKSITRDKLMEYIENSGGPDYPFTTEGKILRIATPNDLAEQSRIEAQKSQYVATAKTLISEMQLPMKLVEVELLLGGEMTTFFFASESRVDFRALVKHLGQRFRTRIQMHQVGARDEARLVADYETCGQHCCCRQFLKVLKPVNMGSAKMQKATLDPSKISGRCGRLKCCLRYEEETYDELRKKLPRSGSRVRTSEGVGVVEEAMILTQLVKVRLDGSDRMVAVAVEELLERDLPAMPMNEMDRPPMRVERNPRVERPERSDRSERTSPLEHGPSSQQPRSERTSPSAKPPSAPRPSHAPQADFDNFVRERLEEPQPKSANDDAAASQSATSNPSTPSSDIPIDPNRPGIGALGRRRRGRGRGRGPGPSSGPNTNMPSA